VSVGSELVTEYSQDLDLLESTDCRRTCVSVGGTNAAGEVDEIPEHAINSTICLAPAPRAWGNGHSDDLET
jgi:hypothetical protein